jgi:hypothetical protein
MIDDVVVLVLVADDVVALRAQDVWGRVAGGDRTPRLPQIPA